MEKNSYFKIHFVDKESSPKRNLEIASSDLDDFFLSCEVYKISSEDVFSTVMDGLFSYLGSKKSIEYLNNFLYNSKGGVKHG